MDILEMMEYAERIGANCKARSWVRHVDESGTPIPCDCEPDEDGLYF